MNGYDSITINGIVYNNTNLNTLSENILEEGDMDWLTAIQSFLAEWFSNRPFIETQSSGSTGIPKIIKLPKQSMINSAQKTIDFFNLSSSHTAFLCIPTQYIGGKMMLVRAIVRGFNLLATRPASNPFLAISTKVDFSAITPYQLYHSIETLKERDIKKIIVGGSPINAKMEEMANALATKIYETYGMTETSSHIALRKVNGKDKSDYFSLFDGAAIDLDDRGCLIITAPFITNERIITNDMAEIIDSRQFRVLGRFDNVINTGGVKVHPEQIEHKLASIIHQPFYITSVPDEILNNRIVLVLEKDNNFNERMLPEKIKGILTKYEIPKEIKIVNKIELTETGKVTRT
jgi:O-succinylbenzoic acid--CoA ligase